MTPTTTKRAIYPRGRMILLLNQDDPALCGREGFWERILRRVKEWFENH